VCEETLCAAGTVKYLAAVAVRPGAPLPEGMVRWEIPALTYAVLSVNGVPGISLVRDYYYHEWLPSSAYTGDAPLMMEVCPASFGEDLTILLHFPIRPR
jgi:predicted transcriptional regulator YdeE